MEEIQLEAKLHDKSEGGCTLCKVTIKITINLFRKKALTVAPFGIIFFLIFVVLYYYAQLHKKLRNKSHMCSLIFCG